MEPDVKRVSRSAYAVIGPDGATNFIIIKGSDGSAALIDADIRRIHEIERALELTGVAKVRYLINTHEHFDHTSANFYFHAKGIPIVASAGSARAMREEGEPDFVRMMKPVAELYGEYPGLKLTLPDVVFADETTVRLPDVTLCLKYCAADGHSHSKGDTTIYFEEDETLAAGDLLYTEVHPVTFFGQIPNWLRSLKPLFETHYRRLVPGHGPAVDGEQQGQASFKRMYDYLEDFHGRLLEIKSGRKSVEEVANYMQSGAYASLGKTRMVQRNINQFLTGKWY
jgi:glyoxylase-like metal-dependent hydrolase (beta-lactamase superfamily II)